MIGEFCGIISKIGVNIMKKIASLALAAIMALGIVACGGTPSSQSISSVDSSNSASSSEKLTKVSVGYMPNYGSLSEVITAKQKGYFAEQGIEVELIEFADGPTIVAAMDSGTVQVGYIGSGAHKLAIQGQAKIFSMAQVSNSDAIVTNTEKGIEEISQLKGKVVGYSTGTTSEQLLKSALEVNNMTMNDIQALEMDASALVTAMLSGQLDACVAWSPMTFTIKEQLGDKYKVLADNLTFSDKAVAISSWIVKPDYAGKNPDTILAFTKALYKAKDFRAEEANYEQVAKWVAEQTKTDFDTAYQQRGDAEWLTSQELVQEVENGNVEKLYQVQQDAFLKNGDIPEKVPVADYVMLDNMKAAAQ